MMSRAPAVQRRRLDLVQTMNRRLLQRVETDRRMEGMIESFELAFRMQTETPKLVDLSGEIAGDPGSLRHRPASGPIATAGPACSPAGSARRAFASSR